LFFAFGDFFKVGVNFGFLALIQGDFGETGFIINFDGGSIFDSALDVVDVDVVAENLLGAGIGFVDWSASKADEGGVGEGIAQVFGETVGGVGSLFSGFFVFGFDDSRFQSVLRTVGFIAMKTMLRRSLNISYSPPRSSGANF
jgi:hypothetical protein